jgi:hypothetical protein
MLSVAPGETAIVNTLSGPFPPQLNVCMFPNPVVVPEYGETRLERPTIAGASDHCSTKLPEAVLYESMKK